MSKRVVADRLTGGTNDVNPQYMSATISTSAANVQTEGILNAPIVRVGSASANSNTAIVLEILKIYARFQDCDADAGPMTLRDLLVSFSSASIVSAGVPRFSDPHVFAMLERSVRDAFTAGGSFALDQESIKVIDLTDGVGHGILVATDNIYVNIYSAGYALSARVDFKIMYRFKQIALVEYIGIVQSQQ